MAVGEAKTLATVKSFLGRQSLEFNEVEQQYCTKLEIRSGARRANVDVYNTGKLAIGGPDSQLKQLLLEMKHSIESDNVLPGQALPFEIDKFPETLQGRIPDCDPVVVRFIQEAINCYKSGALLGCAFMIGAASERAINTLIHTYGDSIRDETNKAKFHSRISNRFIGKKYQEFIQSYQGCNNKPTDPVLAQDLDTLIGAMFQFCRITRNEVGHPQIVPDLDKGVLLSNLGNLVGYMERIHTLAAHFKSKGVIL